MRELMKSSAENNSAGAQPKKIPKLLFTQKQQLNKSLVYYFSAYGWRTICVYFCALVVHRHYMQLFVYMKELGTVFAFVCTRFTSLRNLSNFVCKYSNVNIGDSCYFPFCA